MRKELVKRHLPAAKLLLHSLAVSVPQRHHQRLRAPVRIRGQGRRRCGAAAVPGGVGLAQCAPEERGLAQQILVCLALWIFSSWSRAAAAGFGPGPVCRIGVWRRPWLWHLGPGLHCGEIDEYGAPLRRRRCDVSGQNQSLSLTK